MLSYIFNNQNEDILSEQNIIKTVQNLLEIKRIETIKNLRTKHPEYKIEKHRIRTIHTIYGTIKTKITYLSKPIPKSNKRKTFVVYHDEFLKRNRRKQYDIEFIKSLNSFYFSHKTINQTAPKTPTTALLRYYINQENNTQLLDLNSQNEALINKQINEFKQLKNCTFKLEIDDTFLKFNNQHKRLKHKIRMLILHPIFANQKKIDYSKAMAFYVIEPTNNSNNKPIKELANQLKNTLAKCSIDPAKILINGDGAT